MCSVALWLHQYFQFSNPLCPSYCDPSHNSTVTGQTCLFDSNTLGQAGHVVNEAAALVSFTAHHMAVVPDSEFGRAGLSPVKLFASRRFSLPILLSDYRGLPVEKAIDIGGQPLRFDLDLRKDSSVRCCCVLDTRMVLYRAALSHAVSPPCNLGFQNSDNSTQFRIVGSSTIASTGGYGTLTCCPVTMPSAAPLLTCFTSFQLRLSAVRFTRLALNGPLGLYIIRATVYAPVGDAPPLGVTVPSIEFKVQLEPCPNNWLPSLEDGYPACDYGIISLIHLYELNIYACTNEIALLVYASVSQARAGH